jgi:hypothetical protein
MLNLLLAGTISAFLVFGAISASAASDPAGPHFATALPTCFSKTSPILDSHYGYDDRTCPTKMIEGRAVYEDGQAVR